MILKLSPNNRRPRIIFSKNFLFCLLQVDKPAIPAAENVPSAKRRKVKSEIVPEVSVETQIQTNGAKQSRRQKKVKSEVNIEGDEEQVPIALRSVELCGPSTQVTDGVWVAPFSENTRKPIGERTLNNRKKKYKSKKKKKQERQRNGMKGKE